MDFKDLSGNFLDCEVAQATRPKNRESSGKRRASNERMNRRLDGEIARKSEDKGAAEALEKLSGSNGSKRR